MTKLGQTPSQTVGPYFAYGLTPEQYGYALRSIAGPSLVERETAGSRIRIEGRVLDGEGKPISDAMIEIWQADSQGRYSHPADARGSNASFKGIGRCGTGTDPDSRYWFDTIKPGAIGDGSAPHVNLIVLMRGMLSHAFTRIYFPDEAALNAKDPVLAAVPADRRSTLIAERQEGPPGPVYRFDIHMQGPRETVFFDL
ncbi:MAG: protocatechuate 3,4-dioxygenase subunit alpha [Hyphomicrobiaceae bacterium]|nr:MAG: protocatechuate 3,4-dioxygenase subunit alpha [Hyphomicrobiaceae bacterium]